MIKTGFGLFSFPYNIPEVSDMINRFRFFFGGLQALTMDCGLVP